MESERNIVQNLGHAESLQMEYDRAIAAPPASAMSDSFMNIPGQTVAPLSAKSEVYTLQLNSVGAQYQMMNSLPEQNVYMNTAAPSHMVAVQQPSHKGAVMTPMQSEQAKWYDQAGQQSRRQDMAAETRQKLQDVNIPQQQQGCLELQILPKQCENTPPVYEMTSSQRQGDNTSQGFEIAPQGFGNVPQSVPRQVNITQESQELLFDPVKQEDSERITNPVSPAVESSDEEDWDTRGMPDDLELQNMLCLLNLKFEDLLTCQNMLSEQGGVLQRMVAQLDTTVLLPGGETVQKALEVQEQAKVFCSRSDAVINASAEYLDAAQTQGKCWQKVLQLHLRKEETPTKAVQAETAIKTTVEESQPEQKLQQENHPEKVLLKEIKLDIEKNIKRVPPRSKKKKVPTATLR